MNRCPVCGACDRALRHGNLRDLLYQADAGAWALYRCAECGLSYLDPQPAPGAVGQLYADYPTHASAEASSADAVGTLPAFLRASARDGLRRRYGVPPPAGAPCGGRWLLTLFPASRRTLDHACRHLRPPRAGARLLDVGCGNGSSFPLGGAMGWALEGLEPDGMAVAAACRRGCVVRQGGLPDTGCADGAYAAVTLHHVLEHVHDPVAALREVHRILEPCGWVWVCTPNADGPGARCFGPCWRGFEPPRHLSVFNPSSIRHALRSAGFVSARLLPPRLMTAWYARSSSQIAASAGTPAPALTQGQLAWANLRALLRNGGGEELCVVARKPRSARLGEISVYE